MKNIYKKITISLLIFSVCLSLPVNSVLAQHPVNTGTLSPKSNISSSSLQKANQLLLDQEALLLV
ncbi:MAG: hypothetical protein KAS13_05215 [Candidatus Omnitrophica bacterium]|nr:hypothetical protein [Candidatus Omnitrophota bacterium]